MMNAVRRWIIDHDDRWLFTIAYVGLAVALSILVGLFWLIVVVAIHGVFEVIRQRSYGRGLSAVIWEIKLDLALVILALALAVYMEVILGAAGLGGAARLGAQVTTRAVRATGWGSAIRGVMLSLDDAVQVARVALMRSNPRSTMGTQDTPQVRWSVGDHIAIWIAIISFTLLFASPALTSQSPEHIMQLLRNELRPFPATSDSMHEVSSAD